MFSKIIFILSFLLFLAGCSGVQTFPNMARAGDTVSITMGWQKNFKRSNTTVTITPSVGAPVIYQANDAALRAIVNFYPDPVSWIVVGTDIKKNAGFNDGYVYGSTINNNFTDGDHDWWQTTAFVDLPLTLPVGEATIQFTNDIGESRSSIVEIVSGNGSAESFNAKGNGPLSSGQLASLERSPYLEVSFNAVQIPYAIEMNFSYLGAIHVVNPRSSIKNIIWSGDGSNLKVMLLPAKTQLLEKMHDFKFYIAGEAALKDVQNFKPIALESMQAFDINGNVMTGISISIVANIN